MFNATGIYLCYGDEIFHFCEENITGNAAGKKQIKKIQAKGVARVV